METWSETSLLKLKVSDLKLELKAIKLPQYGTKLILVQRLLDYKEKIETQQILTSNLQNNQPQSIYQQVHQAFHLLVINLNVFL